MQSLMKTLSHACRHHEDRPSDNAWSIRELMEIATFPKKLTIISRKRDMEILPLFQKAQLSSQEQPLLEQINFTLPIVLGIFANPKSRFEVAIATNEAIEHNAEHRPYSEEYVHLGQQLTREDKGSFATSISDISEGVLFVRAVGGHSKTETINRAPCADILQPCDPRNCLSQH